MNGWMILWTILLAGGGVGMCALLLLVTVGAFRELRESLDDLSAEAEHRVESGDDRLTGG